MAAGGRVVPTGVSGAEAVKVELKIVESGDADLFDRIAEGVFDEPLDPDLTTEFLDDPRHHLAVAIVDEEIIGIASAVHYVHPDKPAQLWINEVCVAADYNGRGIGRSLVKTLFEKGRALGCREAWVVTEADNAAARRLYGSLDGRGSSTIMYSFDLSKGS